MSKRKKESFTEPEEQWVDYDLRTLTFMVRELSFTTGHHVHRIRGFMSHAAKAVEEIDWMINALERLRDSAAPREQKGGAR